MEFGVLERRRLQTSADLRYETGSGAGCALAPKSEIDRASPKTE